MAELDAELVKAITSAIDEFIVEESKPQGTMLLQMGEEQAAIHAIMGVVAAAKDANLAPDMFHLEIITHAFPDALKTRLGLPFVSHLATVLEENEAIGKYLGFDAS